MAALGRGGEDKKKRERRKVKVKETECSTKLSELASRRPEVLTGSAPDERGSARDLPRTTEQIDFLSRVGKDQRRG